MSNIRIDIASEFKDKGFKAAEKRTTSLTRKFDNLTRTAKRTFIAIAGFQALKRSVTAFAEEDRAAQRLATSLRNLGLAYNTKAIEDYLEASEKATAINKDQLSPAIAQLISTTLDAQKSMTLLNLAMDISTGTGKDLGSVTTALSRAFNGNFAALGKLQTAYTAAELEAMGFEKTISALSDQFSGAAQKNAETYSGKIELLKIAFGDVAEEIGKGILSFLTSLGQGDYDKGLQKLVNFGTAIGDVFGRAGVSIEYTKALLSTGFRIDEEEMRKLEEIRARFNNPQAAANRVANNPAANRAFLADLRKQQQSNKKIEADRKKAAALAAKTEKERLKREREAQALKRAGTVFDMENIQIVAAMQGKIDGEQRLRLTALLAINQGNAEAAEKLSTAVLATNSAALKNLGIMMESGDNITDVITKIINAQAKMALLALGIGNLPKAKNPFEDWPDIIAAILAQINTLATKISNLGTPTTTTKTTNQNSITVTSNGNGGDGGGNVTTIRTSRYVEKTMCASGEAYYDDTYVDGQLTSTTFVACVIPTNVVGTPIGEGAPTLITNNGNIPLGSETFQVGGANILAGFGTPMTANALDDPNEAAARQRISDIFATIGEFGAGGYNMNNVTVNIAGNVTSEEDLTAAVLDGLYKYQKNGQRITLTAIGI